MSKYNANAGFKNYDVDESISHESVASPFSKIKQGVIIGGVALGALAIIIVLALVFTQGNQSEANNLDETTPQTTEYLDYNELFNVDSEDDITIDNPYASFSGYQDTDTSVEPTTAIPTTTKPLINSSSSNLPNTTKPIESSSSFGNNSNNNNSGNGGGNTTQRSTNSGNTNTGSNNSNNSNSSQSNNNSNTHSSSNTSQSVQQGAAKQSSKTPSTVQVQSVNISSTNLTITEGASANLTAHVSPSNATNKSITWSSGNNSVATVSNGKVIGVSSGSTKIYASSVNGIKAECSVVVKEKPSPVENVYITPTKKTVSVNRTATIELKGASSCTWKFSNPFVLGQVRVSGTTIIVKGIKAGVSNVEAVLPNGKTYKCKVTVK